jgi:hypothetical protein
VIRDDTQIAVQAPPSFTGPEDFFVAVDAAVDDYRVNRQAGQPVRLELWCETAGSVSSNCCCSAPLSFSWRRTVLNVGRYTGMTSVGPTGVSQDQRQSQ